MIIFTFSLLEKLSKHQILSDKEKVEKEDFSRRINIICKTAFDLKVPLFIDAEESWIQTAIDDKVMEMMRKFNKKESWVFNTIQLYC